MKCRHHIVVKTWTKAVHLLTISSFLFSVCVTPGQADLVSVSPESQAEISLAKQFAPPAELGTLTDVHMASTDKATNQPLVIHIQDLHANYGVQVNIAKMLDFLDSKLGAGNYKVAIEGAEGPLLVAQLGKIEDKNFKAKVCDRLMKEVELTGTEYFSIVNGKTDVLVGAEDERYHQANIALFQKTYEGKQQIVKAISGIEAELKPIKDKFYDRAIRKLDQKESDLASHKISLDDYLRFVSHLARKQGIDIVGQYPEVAKEIGALRADRYGNADKLLTEKSELTVAVRDLMAKNDVQRNLSQVEKELGLFKRFMMEQVTTAEVRQMAPKLAAMAGHVKALLASVDSDYDSKNLIDLVSAGLDYYVIALSRDKFLTENALKVLNQIKTPAPTVVLVTGGFHTPGITQLLKEKNVSYITLTPNVTSQTDHDRQLYIARLMDQHMDPKALAATMAQMLSPDLNGGMAGFAAQVFEKAGPQSQIAANVASQAPVPHGGSYSVNPADLPPAAFHVGGVTQMHAPKLADFITKPLDAAAAKRVTVTVTNYNIGHLYGEHTFTLTEDVLDAARTVLAGYKASGAIKDYVVFGFGQDLHVQINSFGQGTQNPKIQAMGLEAALAGVHAAANHGFAPSVNGTDFLTLPRDQQITALRVRPVELPFTERSAEPVFVSKAINGGIGFFNGALVNLFASENVSGPRLEGAGVVFAVESIADIRAGKADRKVYVFGDKPVWDEVDFVRPNGQKPLHVKASQVGVFNEMSVLIGDPTAWVITGVYPARGRMAKNEESRVEPIAVVGVDRVNTDGNNKIPTSPVLMVRQQGGAPSIGESHMATSKFYFGVGGEDEGYYRGLLPVTLQQARSLPDHDKVVKVIGYHYQSSRNGEIPITPFNNGHVKGGEQDIYDQMAADGRETERIQKASMALVQAAAEVSDMVPFMATRYAEEKMAPVRARLASQFTAVPDLKKGEKDPRIEAANQFSKGRTLSDIKADAGGKVGHTVVPSYFIPIAEASLQVAKDKGLIDDFKVFYAGDDLHLLMSHRHGIDSPEVHTLAWETFMRIIWVAQTFGDKWYGLGQDFPNMRNRPIHQDAKLNDQFMAELRKHLPDDQIAQWEKLQHAYEHQTPVTGESPFSGNVQGQGPGFAEINIPDKGSAVFGIFAADKAGPDAFNVPLRHALDAGMKNGSLNGKYGGAETEVWDIHHAERATFNYGQQTADVHTLLAPTHLNSVKRVWQPGSPRILASLSVEKLGIIANGEYIGKDDPVLIAVPEIIRGFFEFARDHFYMTQGNARGSHNAAPKPRSTKDGIATTNSKPVQLGLMVQVSGTNGLVVNDMFDDPAFFHAYDRVDQINQAVWDAQGLSKGLVSVPPEQVEGAYPLRKMLDEITADDSPYATIGDMTLNDTFQVIAAANKPWRSALFAALGAFTAALFVGPVALAGLTFAAFHGVGFVQGIMATKGNPFGVAAVHTKAEEAPLFIQGEELAHQFLRDTPGLGAWISSGSLTARAVDETLANVLAPVLALLLLPVMAARAVVNLISPAELQVNNDLVNALKTIRNAGNYFPPLAHEVSATASGILMHYGLQKSEADKTRELLQNAMFAENIKKSA